MNPHPRASVLLVDDRPGRWASLVDEWQRRDMVVEVEAGVYGAFPRIRAGRYTVVLFPVAAGMLLGASGAGGWNVLERWVDDYAPMYRGRLVYLGTPGEVDAVVGGRRDPMLPPILRVPAYPRPADVRRATDALEAELAAIAERVRQRHAKS